jgi:hypothetical protein
MLYNSRQSRNREDNMKTSRIILSAVVLGSLCLVSAYFMNGCGAMPPSIASITVNPSTIIIGGATTLECKASDPSGKPLVFSWGSTAGSFSSSTGSIVTWTAPAVAGTYLISVSANNGTQSVMTYASVIVVNPYPIIIENLSASPASLAAGGTAAISCDATSSNGHPLSFAWSAASGTLSSPTGQLVNWSAPVTPGTYAVNLIVSDTVLTSVTAAAALSITVSTGPVINSITATPLSLYVGQTSVITCDAADAGATFAWTSSGGALSASTGRSVSWTAPTTAGNYTVSVTVNNGTFTTTSSTITFPVSASQVIIDSITQAPNNPITSGNNVTITCEAHDLGGRSLTYSWASTSTTGSLQSNSGKTVIWSTTGTGSSAINVTVSDGLASATGSCTIVVPGP